MNNLDNFFWSKKNVTLPGEKKDVLQLNVKTCEPDIKLDYNKWAQHVKVSQGFIPNDVMEIIENDDSIMKIKTYLATDYSILKNKDGLLTKILKTFKQYEFKNWFFHKLRF